MSAEDMSQKTPRGSARAARRARQENSSYKRATDRAPGKPTAPANCPFPPSRTVDKLDALFGGSRALFPPRELIPDDFRKSYNVWHKLAERWFFQGLTTRDIFLWKDGVDSTQALCHLAAALKSMDISQEDKLASVAWMMWLWAAGFENQGDE